MCSCGFLSQACFRGHRTRRRIVYNVRSAYSMLCARINLEAFGSPHAPAEVADLSFDDMGKSLALPRSPKR